VSHGPSFSFVVLGRTSNEQAGPLFVNNLRGNHSSIVPLLAGEVAVTAGGYTEPHFRNVEGVGSNPITSTKKGPDQRADGGTPVKTRSPKRAGVSLRVLGLSI
jgi:hypothetical protein